RPLIRIRRDRLGHVKEPLFASCRRQQRALPTHLTGIGREQTGDTFEQSGLACAVRSDQPYDLAGCNLEGYVGEHSLIAEHFADATYCHQVSTVVDDAVAVISASLLLD